MLAQCQPWFVNWLRPRAAAVHTLDATFSSDDSHRLELLLSLLGRCGTDIALVVKAAGYPCQVIVAGQVRETNAWSLRGLS